MLEYTEQRVFACDGPALAAALPAAVHRGAFVGVAELPPHLPGKVGFAGRGMKGDWGLVPEVLLSVGSLSQGTAVEVRVGAALEQNTLVLAVLLLVFCWPAALVCGLLAYQSFLARRAATMQAVWVSIAGAAGVAISQPGVYGVG